MSVATALRQRWNSARFDRHAIGLAAKKSFDEALDVHEKIAARRASLAGDKNLSDIGRAEKLRELAATEAKRVTKAQRVLATARGQVHEGRRALTPAVRDKTDLAAANL